MKIVYRDYCIEVTATGKDSLWAAAVCIERLDKGWAVLWEKGEIDGATNQSDAEIAGLHWARYRVDLFGLPAPKPLDIQTRLSSIPGPLKILKPNPLLNRARLSSAGIT